MAVTGSSGSTDIAGPTAFDWFSAGSRDQQFMTRNVPPPDSGHGLEETICRTSTAHSAPEWPSATGQPPVEH